MTFKSCFVEQSILAHTAVPSVHVPCRISLIEHGLNWINHILHVGAQGPLNGLDYEAKQSRCYWLLGQLPIQSLGDFCTHGPL